MERWTRRSNQVVTPQEEQTRTFQRFVSSTFFEEEGGRWGNDDDEPTLTNNYTIYPHFYSYVNYLHSDEWPLLNTALEAYIASRLDGRVLSWTGRAQGRLPRA